MLFVVITYGFGFFCKLLFVFLLDIDLLYAAKLAKALPAPALGPPSPSHGGARPHRPLDRLRDADQPHRRPPLFKIPGPHVPRPRRPASTGRCATRCSRLFEYWHRGGLQVDVFDDLKLHVRAKVGERNILPDLAYLMELGAVVVTTEGDKVVNVRLSA